MSTPHRATDEQWEKVKRWAEAGLITDSVVYELLCRIEILEATQHLHADGPQPEPEPVGARDDVKGLHGKFIIHKANGEPVKYPCFVLRIDGKDAAAISAFRAYAIATEDTKLRQDMLELISPLAQPEPADLSSVSWPDPGPITARAVFADGKCYLLDTQPEPEPPTLATDQELCQLYDQAGPTIVDAFRAIYDLGRQHGAQPAAQPAAPPPAPPWWGDGWKRSPRHEPHLSQAIATELEQVDG